MVNLPSFTHIHCSSRYDRTVASLERDLDSWMKVSSLITLTEVATDARARTMREAGWGLWNSPSHTLRADDCAILWDLTYWREQMHMTRNLYGPFRQEHRVINGITACTNLLRHQKSGHKLLTSVTHMPLHAGIKTPGHRDARWDMSQRAKARRVAYQQSMKHWNTHIDDQVRLKKPDAVLIVADWNFNLKLTWVRRYLNDSFGRGYHQAWTRFPTHGGSLRGGPVAPLGAPGRGRGDRIIDGSMMDSGLRVSTHPNLMARTISSDHRPYKEGFTFTRQAGKPGGPIQGGEDASGDIYEGDAWWGFGDYMDDELYPVDTAIEEKSEGVP